MTSFEQLAAEFAITVINGDVWLSIGLALLLGAGCLLFGMWVSRTVGLLARNAPAGETLGVGLASGLIVLAAWWAAIWSGGRSSFTPVAVGFAMAIGLALVFRTRRRRPVRASVSIADRDLPATRRRSLVLTALAGSAFIVVVALLYGSTMAPSPRDGVQPVEFTDEAFYSILGRDLAETGTETNLGPSGFSELPGFPAQAWYHWAEIWLASAVITIFGTAPLAARHFVVLPLVLLAAAAMTGTLVRRLAPTVSRRAYVFGFLACLFLAPVAVRPIPYFSASNVGMIFGITTYGLAAVAVLLVVHAVVEVNARKVTWGRALFVGCAVAVILPSHIVVALLALVGVGTVAARRFIQAMYATRRLPVVSVGWRYVLVAAAFTLVATLVWGLMTGHSQGGGGLGPVLVSPFNQSWREYVAITILGGGAFFAIGVAWFLVRTEPGVQADLYLGTMALLLAGAIAWGSRLHEFTMFHFFFGGIAVFAAPVAAVAIRTVWGRLRATNHQMLAVGLVAVCVIQLEIGAVNATYRLQSFGPHEHEPIPVAILSAIEDLPPGAKLAYACGQFEEIGFATPALLSIDAHTGHRVVPMCFAAERLSGLIGAESYEHVPSLYYEGAPQRVLFPVAAAAPSSAAIVAFLREHGIDYIYADSRHANSLVSDVLPIATIGAFSVLKVP